jgi:hypothetical protein
MIPNISKGSKPVGLMKYLAGPGYANEHTEPHLVAGSGHLMAWYSHDLLNEDSAADIANEVDINRQLLGVKMDHHVWHCSLSLSRDEGHLQDDGWEQIVHDFMDQMGFTSTSGKAPCDWVAVHHGTSKNGNDHVHIMASMVRGDGTKWSDWNDFSKSQSVCRGLEKQYGLEQLGRHNERGYKRGEPTVQGLPYSQFLERTVRACAMSSSTEAEFVRSLRRENLLVFPRMESGEQKVVGYSVAMRPEKGKQPLRRGAKNLAKDLTIDSLQGRWPQTEQDRKNAYDEWFAAKHHLKFAHTDSKPRPLTRDEARAMSREIFTARQRMRQVPLNDHAAWAEMAREASGVFAAWSLRTEGGRGPLQETSRKLSRASNSVSAPHRQHVRDTSLNLTRSAALMMVASSNNAFAQAVLMHEMLRTIKMFADLFNEMHELRESQRLMETARERLREVAGPLPEPPADVLAENSPRPHAGTAGPARGTFELDYQQRLNQQQVSSNDHTREYN